MMTLLPVHLKKAFVRGHLRNLGGRMVEVKPYHTKAQPRRDDDRSRELFGDIPPAGNQIQPRMHPARTTTPRTPIVPFKAVFPQLFDEKEVATVQNGQYTKDIKGRNPAPATEGTKMTTAQPTTATTPRTLAELLDEVGAKDDTGKPVHPSVRKGAIKREIEDAKTQVRAYEERPRPALAEKIAAKKAWIAEAEAALAREEGHREPPTTTPTAGRIYLTVPFSEKDKVKAKGAKWDGDKKKWYWPTSAGEMPAVVKGYAK